MTRISRHMMWMEIAVVASRRSTCYRRNVGAVIVRNRNIVSIGYNGPPSGESHCYGNTCTSSDGICTRAVHAEKNAIDRMPTHDFPSCVMYTTESPCPVCAGLILEADIKELYYLHPYRLTEGIDLIAQWIPTYRMTPAGLVIKHLTNQIMEDTS